MLSLPTDVRALLHPPSSLRAAGRTCRMRDGCSRWGARGRGHAVLLCIFFA